MQVSEAKHSAIASSSLNQCPVSICMFTFPRAKSALIQDLTVGVNDKDMMIAEAKTTADEEGSGGEGPLPALESFQIASHLSCWLPQFRY